MSAALAGSGFSVCEEWPRQPLSFWQRASSRRDIGHITVLKSQPEPAATAAAEPNIPNIRARIADGTYITDEMIDVVVDRLLDALRDQPA